MLHIALILLLLLSLSSSCFLSYAIPYLTGWPVTQVGRSPLPSHHQNHPILVQNSPLWPCIEQCNPRYHSESTSATLLHVLALCPVFLHRPHRLWAGSPPSARTRFFAFFPSPRAPNSLSAVELWPSLTVRVPSLCTRFLLRNLRPMVASLAAQSSAISFCANTSLCTIIAAPFETFSKASTIEVGELSTCL
jgi:hypothetical protein